MVKRWLRQNPHAWWALGLPYILLLFFLPEQRILSSYIPTQLPLDRCIPFCPPFVIFYVLWFPLLALTGLWLLLRDGRGFRRYMLFLCLAYTISAIIFLLFPNGQDLRPALDEPRGVFERLLAGIYTADTNTNVLPSLHVVGALEVVFALYGSESTRGSVFRPLSVVLALLIIAATVLVKQHALLDLLAGALLSALLWFHVYCRRSACRRQM